MKARKLVPAVAASMFAILASVCAHAQDAMPGHDTMQAKGGDKVLTILKPLDAAFKAVPNAASCNTMLSLRGDMSKEASTFTSRMTPGCVAPWHWHKSTEEIVMQQGTARMQMEDSTQAPVTLRTGSYSQLPRDHLHRFKCLKGPDCVILVIADRAFDIHWVDKKRNEITFDEALALEKKSPAW
jgi:quercetin dioxygenase-like cupin family protein